MLTLYSGMTLSRFATFLSTELYVFEIHVILYIKRKP